MIRNLIALAILLPFLCLFTCKLCFALHEVVPKIPSKVCQVEPDFQIQNFADIKAPDESIVAAHVTKLAAPKFSDRESASKALKAMDLSILKSKEFADAFDTSDAEVRQRIHDVRKTVFLKHVNGVRYFLVKEMYDDLNNLFPILRDRVKKQFADSYKDFHDSIASSQKIGDISLSFYNRTQEEFFIDDVKNAFANLVQKRRADSFEEIELGSFFSPTYVGRSLVAKKNDKYFLFYSLGHVSLSLNEGYRRTFNFKDQLKKFHSKDFTESEILNLLPCMNSVVGRFVEKITEAEININPGSTLTFKLADAFKIDDISRVKLYTDFNLKFLQIPRLNSNTGQFMPPTYINNIFSSRDLNSAEEDFKARSLTQLFKIQ